VVTNRTAIARYVALGAPRPGRVSRLRLKRSGHAVTVTWRGAASAAAYRVKLTGKGTSQVKLLGRSARRIRFTAIARTGTITVEVRARGRRGELGAARRAAARGALR
jgi:hypothetical protein